MFNAHIVAIRNLERLCPAKNFLCLCFLIYSRIETLLRNYRHLSPTLAQNSQLYRRQQDRLDIIAQGESLVFTCIFLPPSQSLECADSRTEILECAVVFSLSHTGYFRVRLSNTMSWNEAYARAWSLCSLYNA